MARTPQDIIEHHLHALVTGDIDALVSDYADDAVLITPRGVVRGRDGVRAAFTKLVGGLPADAAFDVKTKTFDGDILLLEWVLDSPVARTDGVDTFVFGDGAIRVQTIAQIEHPKA